MGLGLFWNNRSQFPISVHISFERIFGISSIIGMLFKTVLKTWQTVESHDCIG